MLYIFFIFYKLYKLSNNWKEYFLYIRYTNSNYSIIFMSNFLLLKILMRQTRQLII